MGEWEAGGGGVLLSLLLPGGVLLGVADVSVSLQELVVVVAVESSADLAHSLLELVSTGLALLAVAVALIVRFDPR